MRSALYFPHTEIKNMELLKSSMLLWDKVHYIVPYAEYKPVYENLEFAEAIELIGEGHYPTQSEKKETHDIIEDFATTKLPDVFYYFDKNREHYSEYEIYPQKFLPETWDMLRNLQLAGNPLVNADYPLSEPAGLSVMSILADCCAGDTKARITDRGSAYATIANLCAATAEDKTVDHNALVSLSMSVLNISNLPLKNLIDFRKRELKEGNGSTYTALRHSYVKQIETATQEMCKAKRPGDINEIKRNFESDMQKDWRALNSELWRAKVEVAFSRESLATLGTIAAATVAAHLVPFAIPGIVALAGPPAVVVGGLIATSNKYATNRASILQKHPMAYLYELNRTR